MSAVAGDRCAARAGTVSFEVARRVAPGLVRPHGRVEAMPLAAARGRVLAEAVVAPGPLPPFDQAAMDEYAVRLAGRGGLPLILPVAGRTDAGDAPGRLLPGTAHRIMTGAALPRGADTVVMEEQVTRKGSLARIEADLPANTHIRRAGEDVPPDAVVLSPGRRLDWPEIGLLAALGIAAVCVAAPVRIAILPTGSELHATGAAPSPGGIHDANGPMLAALLSGGSAEVTVRRVEDDAPALAEALAEAAATHDLVVTTGGMAAGLGDHVRAAVAAAGGRLEVAGVAMKPGKPLGLGRIGTAGFVGLPGNPQASAFAALAFVRPMIAGLAGAAAPAPQVATLAFSGDGRAGRVELAPVRLAVEDGRPVARRSGPAGSHRMTPMADADAVAIVPDTAETGTTVEVLPFGRWQEG